MKAEPVTVLVVDDEEPIREELRAFPWESCGMTLIGEAENGMEALALCEVRPPDIVVSDITMPLMDGLTFIQELRARHPGVQAILLTCHSDFHYAQEAIRLGALDYILKVSLDEEELKSVLRKAANALARERGHRREELKLRRAHTARWLDAVWKEHCAAGGLANSGQTADGMALSGGTAASGETAASDETAAPVTGSSSSGTVDWTALGFRGEAPYRFARLWLSVPYGTHLILHDFVQTALLDFELDNRRCAAAFPFSNDEWLIWFTGTDDNEPLGPILDRLFADIRSAVGRTGMAGDWETALHAVLSGPIREREQLLSAMIETADWKDHAFYLPAGGSSFSDAMPEPLQPFRDHHRKSLLTMLRRNGWDSGKLVEFVEGELVRWCGRERVRPGPLKQCLARWAADWAADRGSVPWDGGDVSALLAAPNLNGMIEAFTAIVRAADAGKERMRPEIREALSWIRANLKEPLSLPLISERAGLSPEYFSRLFKEETGESVNQYITRLRMEKAMELLKHSNLKVYEVAEAVGIPNYRYFAYTFRNWAGAAPTEVKRRRPAER